MAEAGPRPTADFHALTGTIWEIADLRRGDYKQADDGKVVLPMTVLRRLDCVPEPTKGAVLKKVDELKEGQAEKLDRDNLLASPLCERRGADQAELKLSELINLFPAPLTSFAPTCMPSMLRLRRKHVIDNRSQK